jgi:MFS family permease
MFGAALSLVLLDKSLFPVDLGWRLAFGLGAVLGLGILLVRRNVPESPRWLFIHGHNDQAEELVDKIEGEIEEETGERLEEVTDSIRIRQRRAIGFGTIAHTAFKLYPKRTVLGLALFTGQAFLYAVGTGVGGVTGPALFGKLVETGKEVNVFYGYLLGAVLMIAAGIAEWFIGVEAAGRSLEDVARPLTAEEEAEAPA